MNDFQNMPVLTDNETEEMLDICAEIIKVNLPAYTYQCQNHSSVNDIYPPCENDQWSCGFWPGEVWLAYEHTGEAVFREAAQELVKSFYNRIVNKVQVDHHGMGLLYTPSCVAAYKLTESELAKEAAILAAKQLASRFQEKHGFIEALEEPGKSKDNGCIISSLMDLPLLYWASEAAGEPEFSDMAQRHITTCLRYFFRENGRACQILLMERKTGKLLKGINCQGYNAESCWARGQAWSIYGTALSYRYTKDTEDKKLFYRALDYYLSALPKDMVPFWDLIFTDGDDEPRDSSAASIAVCGMLEMAKHVDRYELKRLTALAGQMLKSLADRYAVKNGPQGVGLVRHGTYSKRSPHNSCTPEGVDESVSWGDYFYIEALTRYYRNWEPYW